MKLKIVKIVEIVCTCLAGILAIGFSFFIIQKIAFENKPISLLGLSIYEVTDDRLASKNNIEKGALVITVSNKNYQINDVVLYEENDKYQLEVIVDDGEGKLSIRRYNIPESIENFNIIGKKLMHVNNYASFKEAVLNPVTIIILGVVFFGGLIACFVLEKVFTAQAEKEESKTKEEN